VRDIGHGVSIEEATYEGHLYGFRYEHPGLRGEVCKGWIPIQPECPLGWVVEKMEPLTLSPSLVCRLCGHHGFIRDGRWVPAGS